MKVKMEVRADMNPDRLLICRKVIDEYGHEIGKSIIRVIELEDEAVRNSLIQLGWTPPGGMPSK